MKNKSTRHKDQNTFKFQPFAERISNIDVDIFHKVGHEYETETDEDTSYFYQSIQKWDLLNLSESYNTFRNEVKGRTMITLPQVILHKDHIIMVLIKHLKLRNPLSLQALLDIVVALAKDLRNDFYPHYHTFLDVLINLLNTKDTEQLEWIFTCLAYLFKFLWRPIIKDIGKVFVTLLPLLSSNKPEYINGFAAGSFAFIARKVKDRKSFLFLILETVKTEGDGVEGCGKLLFEVINGIDGQFHSCAETMLSFLFESLSDSEQFPQQILFEILEQFIANLVQTIRPDKSEVLWEVFVNVLNNHQQSLKDLKSLELLLKLVGQSIEHKNGKLLKNPTNVIKTLISLLNTANLPEEIYLILTQIGILLLLSTNIKLQQEQASMIVRKVLSIPNETILLYFVDNISNFSSFEALILPNFLNHCLQTNLNEESFKVLTKLILKKSPIAQSGLTLLNCKKYSIDFNNSIIENILKKHLTNFEDSFENYLCSLICLPHIITSNDAFVEILETNIQIILEKLKTNSTDYLKVFLFLLNSTVECLIRIKGNLLKLFEQIIDCILELSTNIDCLNALKIVDMLITHLQNDGNVIKIENLKRINSVLEPNFNSSYHEMRLLTAHIYTFFEQLDEFTQLRYSTDSDLINPEQFSVFSICFKVESIDSQVQTYRNQTQLLEKLNFDKPQMIMCNKTDFKTVPLRYLCGALYINFKLLWEPIGKIIETHAHGLEIDSFWNIFGNELVNCVDRVQNEEPTVEFNYGFLMDLYQDSVKLEMKPDFINYRLLLWKTLTLIPDIAEIRNRTVAELFLNFMEKEYTKINSDAALKWNIKQNACLVEDSLMEDEEMLEESEDLNKEITTNKKKINNKSNMAILVSCLQVFSKMRNPRSMYRESDLNKLYYDLLQHKSSEIQKLTLDCILTYKYKYLTPYKTNLYNLIDDKNFKNELITFQINKDSSLIQLEHRQDLIPIIMKIVFSKMTIKQGLRTGGKSSGQLRRTLVLRFLAGCEENELLAFLKMSFRYYTNYLNENPEEIVSNLTKIVDLESFLPPKRLQSSLNMLMIVFEQFGGLMGTESLKFLLKIILIISGTIKEAFDQINLVHKGFVTILKSLRSTCLELVEIFFNRFDKYPWDNREINAIFQTLVWPYLSKLHVEGIHSPTNLLKLFIQWGTNPRYFCLLIKHYPNDLDNYVLPKIIQLLLNENCNTSVVNLIFEMIEKLLSLQTDTELILPVDDLLTTSNNVSNNKLNYGSCILLPEIGKILKKIKTKLESKFIKNLSTKELFILSRVSELVLDSDLSDQILELLLPVVLKKSSKNCEEEIVKQYLTTLINLFNNINEPLKHLKLLTPLFGEVTYASCRKLLLELLKTIKLVDYELIEQLNAFDKNWVDQPDFEKRHNCFKQINQILIDGKIDLKLGVLLIYNCYYLLKNEKDLSLKENSIYCLKQLCPILIKKYYNNTENGYILDETIFTLIRNGMRGQDIDFRNECIKLLGHLSRECPENHFIFRDLNKFTNKEDLEVDCFENLTHLQLHRHVRALLKFSKITETYKPNSRTLTQFVLPLVSFYLCSEKYANKNSLIDAAVDCVGTICKVLPWHQYESLLKYYLTKLRSKVDYQKQLVKLIVRILDSFHYDLKKGLVTADLEVNLSEIDEETDEKIVVICKSTATKIIKTIQHVLLPQLHQVLAKMTTTESKHKLNRKLNIEREEEDLLRVPISLALVKLLQKLPKDIMDLNLPGIFMKMCTFLKSNLESVRRITRLTLEKIILTLGPSYLGMLLESITPLLNRGFQVHVLVFTVHAILNCLKPIYKPGDIDRVLLSVLSLCKVDIFGVLAEEKEVVKIRTKTSEAKSTKSYDTLQILSQFCTDQCLMELILPIKEVLCETHSFKMIHRAQEALRFIVLGLVDNQFVTTESLLKFSYGTASESIVMLIPIIKSQSNDKKIKGKLLEETQDCFIIPKLINHRRAAFRQTNVKLNSKANAHVLVEFGLRLCLVLLKRDKLKEERFKSFIDPFVLIFKNCLTSKHVKLSTLTLQCLTNIMKYDLPSLHQHIAEIAREIFTILHKYGSAGLSKGDNFDLVLSAFKTMSVMVRDIKYHTLETEQLKLLLLYVEQDLHNYDRQASAFNLLKSIITRKLIIPEIHEIMEKVAELSIISELNHVRVQARLVFHQFFMEYPMGNKLETYLNFYISQMSYELQYGRESALEMIQMLINSFPMKVLVRFCGSLLITLGARLVNDEVPELRKMVAERISAMIARLPTLEREPLFDIILEWFKDKNINHRRLAAQLCGIFITVEQVDFAKRLPKLMPLLLLQFGYDNSPGQFVRVKKENETPITEEDERIKDHYLYQVLEMLLKLCTNCPVFLQQTTNIQILSNRIQTLLAYPHDWVRLNAAQFLSFVLSTIDIEKLSQRLLVEEEEEEDSDTELEVGYLFIDPRNSVKSLTLDLCDQLQPGSIKQELADEVVKNLVFVAKILENVQLTTTTDNGDNKINLFWLTKRMRKIVNSEVIQTPTSSILRHAMFKWTAKIGNDLKVDSLLPVLNHLLAPLVREMITTEESNAPLRQLSKEVGNIFKRRLGMERYLEMLSKLQQSLTVRRAERKRARNQLAVTDPEVFAKKKIKRHEKKTELRKRKNADRKGKKMNFKRRKVVDLEDNSEVM